VPATGASQRPQGISHSRSDCTGGTDASPPAQTSATASKNETPEQRSAAVAAAQEAAETARLRKRVRDLEQEIEILKRFTAYWVSSEGQR